MTVIGPPQFADNPKLTAAGHIIKFRKKGRFSGSTGSDSFVIYDKTGRELRRGSFTKDERANNKRRETRAFDELSALDAKREVRRQAARARVRAIVGRRPKTTPTARTRNLPETQGTRRADRFHFSKKYNDFIDTKSWEWKFKKNVKITDKNREKVAALLENLAEKKLRHVLTKKGGEDKLFFLVINHKAKIKIKGKKGVKSKTVEQGGYSNRRVRLSSKTLPKFLKDYFHDGFRRGERSVKQSYAARAKDYLARLMSAAMYVTGIKIEMLDKKGKPEHAPPAKPAKKKRTLTHGKKVETPLKQRAPAPGPRARRR